MNKKIIACFVLLFPNFLVASPVFHPSGPNLTYGAVSQVPTVLSDINNPAGSAASMKEGKKSFAFGILSSVGVGLEIGQVDNMFDDLDRLSTELNNTNIDLATGNQLVNEFNALLMQMGQHGYVNVNAAAHVPLMPLVINSKLFGGSLVFDANVAGQSRMSVLDAPVTYNPIAQTIESNTAVYIKAAQISELSLSYSRRINSLSSKLWNLYVGGRAKYLGVGLNKSVVAVMDNADTQSAFEDRMSSDFTESTGVGFDVGAMLTTRWLSLGVTAMNINKPSFDFPAIGQNCAALTGSLQTDCYTAAGFAGEIDLNETHTMDMQVRAEAALHTKSRKWMITSSLDMNKVYDPVGNEHQWAVASVAFINDGWILPSIRVGARQNLAGSELGYVTAGLTLFKMVNIDAAISPDMVQLDPQSEMPRGVMLNIGVEFGF